MSTIRIRVTGRQDQADALMTALHGLDNVERVELVADHMRGMRNEDSSSNSLSDDIGQDLHCLEVETSVKKAVASVHDLAETSARLGIVVEFVDRF